MPAGKRRPLLASLSSLALCATARAAPWVTVGPRALGMGGAYTAIAEGPAGAYYNPAALGVEEGNPSGVELNASARYEADRSVLSGASDLNQIVSQCPGGPNCTSANIQSALARMRSDSGQGALAEAAAGLDLKFGRMAFFAQSLQFRGATPLVDLANATPGTVADNQSDLRLRGGSFYEFGVGMGREVLESGVFVGANAKAIVGRTGYTDFFVAQENPDVGVLERSYDRSGTVSVRPGLDLGLLWDVRETFPEVGWHPRLALVGRNVNAPSFAMPERAVELGDPRRFYTLQGQSRAGVAFDPLQHWTVSADLDVTENLTDVERYTSRLYGVGSEVRLFDDPDFSIPLRAGVSKNIAQGNSGTLFHAGFGLHFTYFMLDVAGAVSSQRVYVQTVGQAQRLPHQAAASLQLSLLFGGAESITEPSRNPYAPTRPDAIPTRDPFE